jgi:hypothetical protein
MTSNEVVSFSVGAASLDCRSHRHRLVAAIFSRPEAAPVEPIEGSGCFGDHAEGGAAGHAHPVDHLDEKADRGLLVGAELEISSLLFGFSRSRPIRPTALAHIQNSNYWFEF